MIAGQRYIPTLDGWRALAIVAVMACHASGYFFSKIGLFPNPTLHAYLFHGTLGVDVFFVLSGFLICSGLAAEHDTTGRINLSAFYTRRVCRIFPPYFLYLLAVGLLGSFGLIAVSKRELVACLFFVRNFVNAPGWYTVHFWTLAVEEHFYLLFPSVLVLTQIRRPTRWVFGILILTTLFRLLNENGKLLGSIITDSRFNPGGDDRINELIVGAWLALVMHLPKARDYARGLPAALCIPLIALVIYSTAHPLPFQILTLPLILGSLIILTSHSPSSIFGRFLEFPLVRWVGRLSYSLYLWQQLFLVLDVAPSALPLGMLQHWPVAPLAVFGCATVSYYCVERPFVRFGKRKSAELIASYAALQSGQAGPLAKPTQ